LYAVQSADHAGLPVVDGKRAVIVEFGPRLNFSTAWSANAATIILQCGIKSVKRIERSRRLLLQLEGKDINAFDALKSKFFGELHDKMTECIYEVPLESFDLNVVSEVRAT
jgi:phosphoribosylformylglycinamidine synthase